MGGVRTPRTRQGRGMMTNDSDRIQEVAEKEAGAEDTREFRIFGPP